MSSKKPSGARGGIYLVEVEYGGQAWFKVGSATDFRKRVASLQTGCPVPYRRIRSMELSDPLMAAEVEASIHIELEDLRQTGEWFAGIPDVVLIDRIQAILVAHGAEGVWADVARTVNTPAQAKHLSHRLREREISARLYRAQREADVAEDENRKAAAVVKVRATPSIRDVYRGGRPVKT